MQVTDPILAAAIRPTADFLVIVLSDRELRVPWEQCSPRLASATQDERFDAELSPGGYGVHWAILDEDLSINGLVRRMRDLR